MPSTYAGANRSAGPTPNRWGYILPTFEHEALTLATWLVGGDGRLAMERCFQLVRDSDGATMLRGRWDLVCIELASGKPRRMPQEFLDVYMPVITSRP